MSTGGKLERTCAALAGERPDLIPISLWHHFDPGHVSGRAMAEAHLEHLRKYDLDYLKVMNDNPYDMPESLPVIEEPGDWRRLEPLPASAPGFTAQLEGLRILARQLAGQVMMTTTIFNAFATSQKLCDRRLPEHLQEDPDSVMAGLATVTESLCILARECLAAGADGVYLACSGNAENELSSDDYAKFVLDHDRAVLAAADAGTFNFVHVHGDGVDLSLFMDLPGNCLNWNSRLNPPSLRDAAVRTRMCLVGGWEQNGAVARGPVQEIVAEARDAIEQTGGRHLLLGAGCTIPSDTPEEFIRAAVRAARQESRR